MTLLRLIWATLGGLWSVLMMLIMAASLALNVAMAVSPVIAAAVGGAVQAVSGVRSLASRNADNVARLETRAVQAERRAAAASAEAADARAARKVTYRGARATAAEAVADTSDRLARRTATATARNVGSVFGEALPVVGIGVIAAATAWELHDACEMMKDMRELDVAMNPDRALPPEATAVCGMQAPSRTEIWNAVASSPGSAWEGAQGFYDELPELSLGGFFERTIGMFRATYDWAFAEPVGPLAADGTAPAAPSDLDPRGWVGQ
ncbi:hypothetical protein GI374_04685 [Paracoccus sp. S-4012]|uniref:hypothetical protein n=1 Tax=Paracoccus sp. S-4012 TaxID=2665648 RepID=UPI0012AFA76E|nr:hypothetical protein [Paracoccus sp. S-4012]MRX49757.1 hypothetical protein [Paracoccus sp. S-4012]